MQIKPRRHLLDIWRAAARHSFDDGKLIWEDTDGLSSVADAERLLRLGEQVLEHLWDRRIEDGEGAGLWEHARAVHPDARGSRRLSWSITERVTECLVAARNLYEQQPIRSPEPAELARDLLSEATHLFGKEQLEASAGADGSRGRAMRSMESRLDHARSLVDDRPATAFALALPVFQELDTLAQARGAAAQEV